MSKKVLGFVFGAVVLAGLEFLWLSPLVPVWLPEMTRSQYHQALLRWATVYGFLLLAHLFYLHNLIFHILLRSRRMALAYVAWYGLMFGFFMAVAMGPASERLFFGGMHRLLLFGLFLFLTGAFFHVPAMLGFLAVVQVTYFVFPFFAEATLAQNPEIGVMFSTRASLLDDAHLGFCDDVARQMGMQFVLEVVGERAGAIVIEATDDGSVVKEVENDG